LDRRQVLRGVAAAGAAAALAGLPSPQARPAEGRAVSNCRIKQSIVFWCFNTAGEKWDADTTAAVGKGVGCLSVELAAPTEWDAIKKHGLTIAIAPNGMPGQPFKKGFNNPAYHEEVIGRTKQMIDACVEAKVPSVIGFTGYKWRDPEDPK